MGTITTTRPVTPHQLADELDGAVINTRGAPPESDGPKEIEVDGIDEAALEAAVEVHEADPEYGQPPAELALTSARKRADAVIDGTDTFTLKEVGGIVAALLRRQA